MRKAPSFRETDRPEKWKTKNAAASPVNQDNNRCDKNGDDKLHQAGFPATLVWSLILNDRIGETSGVASRKVTMEGSIVGSPVSWLFLRNYRECLTQVP